MNISELCQRNIVAVDANDSIRTAANAMRERHVGEWVITSGSSPRTAIGVVTDRDLTIEVLANGIDPASLRIGQVARGALIDVAAEATLKDAVEAMERGGVRRLLVVDEDDAVIGIVAADDVLAAVSSELEGLSRALRSGIERETTERSATAAPGQRPMFVPDGMVAME
jgi:signal-transduction protein with cAMP-binding, CBS, and nucleotidyltransferase domain